MNEKRTVTLEPVDGIDPLYAFDLIFKRVNEQADAAGISGIFLYRADHDDDIALVGDAELGWRHLPDGNSEARSDGLTVSRCEITEKSVARNIIRPGYALARVGEQPNDPQEGEEMLELGEFYGAYELATAIILEVVRYRIEVKSHRNEPEY